MPAYKRTDEWSETWHYRKLVTLPNGTKKRIHGTPAINTKRAAELAERAHIERALNPSGIRFGLDVGGRCDGCTRQYEGDVRWPEPTAYGGVRVFAEAVSGRRKYWRACWACWASIEPLLSNYGCLARAVNDLGVASEDDFPERIDAHVERMRSKYPTLPFTRKHAVRQLLLRALCAEEQPTKKQG